MEVREDKLNRVVLPGDDVGAVVSTKHGSLGAGLMQDKERVVATRAGVLHLMPSSSRVYFVETDQRRYVPKEGDMNIGIIVERHIENYTVDIGAAALASLPTVAFDGATRRNKPNLTSGDTVFCRVSVANKDMDPEITCETPSSKHRKDWVTGESVYGQLKGGTLINISLSFSSLLLLEKRRVLQIIGEHMKYEVAVGHNGVVWVKSSDVVDTVLLCNMIKNAEKLTDEESRIMIETLVKKRKTV